METMIVRDMIDGQGMVWRIEFVLSYILESVDGGAYEPVRVVGVRNMYRKLRYGQKGAGGFSVYRAACHGAIPTVIRDQIWDHTAELLAS